MNKVEQHITNAKRFRKANYKPLIEYINWSEITEDYDLKTGDLDYSDYNKLELILESFVNNNNTNNIRFWIHEWYDKRKNK